MTIDLEALARQASALRAAGRVDEAISAYEQLLAIDPARPNTWYNLALLQRRARRPAAALQSYEQALRQGLDGPEEAHLNRAVIFSDDLRRPEDARRELQRALTLQPRYLPALLNLGNLHEDLGEREAAVRCYDQALAVEPGHSLALARRAQVTQAAAELLALVPRLQAALKPVSRSAAERAELGFALGRLLDACGRHDEAFAAYTAANRDSRQSAPAPGPRYDQAAHEATITAIQRTFAKAAAAGDGATRASPPIFICGMFRSGSTLAEQVLASHPQVRSGGELDILPGLVQAALQPFPQAAAALDESLCAALAQRYRDQLAQVVPGAHVVTDKRPDNYLYVGLIKRLFPQARIVHTRRQPLDNCLSVYFLHLGHAKPYALDLLDTGHYLLQQQRLMDHWKALYPDDILDFDYDAFVQDPRTGTARLLAFCGLPWDERCLAFHEAETQVRTASVWQVREPLYRRASGRWQHYRKHLGGLAALLGVDLEAAPG
jgi:tetratricopeptide (TPR) repeat protein